MIDTIAVVVPAADEETTIDACLVALAIAADRVDCAVRTVVVLDSCTDRTADVTADHAAVEAISIAARNVGVARRTGAAHALLGFDPTRTLLASTDADSTVPPHWLAHLRDLATTADLVLGTVLPAEGLAPTIETAWYEQHFLVEGHPHVHAANLAVRADAYRLLGGWRPLAAGEDEDLARRAECAGLRIRRTALAPVRTSNRAQGRAPRGFSSYLRELGHSDVG